MGAALGLGALLRRAGLGQALSLLAMLAGFVVVAGLLLFPDTLFLLLPTKATLVAMADAARAGLDGVARQAAPVAPTPEFLLLTCAGAWAVATSADGLTFRAGQPLLALVPALGLFVFPAVIRPVNPAWYTFWFLLGAAALLLHEGRARLATWGRWVPYPSTRPAIGWRPPLTRASSVGRWLAVASGAVALSMPWVLPGYGQPPALDYRTGQAQNGPVSLNPFVSLRTNLQSQSDAEFFTVRANERTYWRLMVLDRFDGVTWEPSKIFEDLDEVGEDGLQPPDHEPGAPVREVRQEIEIRRLAGPWLPAAPSPVAVDAGRDLMQSPVNKGLSAGRQDLEGFKYTVVSQVLEPTAEHLDGPQDYSDPALEPYLDAAYIDRDVRAIAEHVTRGKDTPYEQALALQDWLRSDAFTYDLSVPELASGRNQLERFLTTVRRGYCQQFAGAMAAMARAVGIPARVAVGFTPGVASEGRYVVTGEDAHAWPELYFTGVGWVRFEPTPRNDGQTTTPVYTLIRDPTPAPAPETERPTAPTTPPATVTPDGRPDPEAGTISGVPTTRPPAPLERRAVQLPLLLILLVALVPAAKAARHLVARRRAARRPRDAIAGSYMEVTDWAADAGIGRRPAETPSAYARRMAARYDGATAELAELTELYLRSEYGPAAPDPAQAHRARSLARAARRRLAAQVGWERRLLAAVSPRSLLERRPRRARTLLTAPTTLPWLNRR